MTGRTARAAAGMLATVLLVAGGVSSCSSEKGDSGRACKLLLEPDAESVLGSGVEKGKPSKADSGVAFDSRCLYESGKSSLQLSIADEKEGESPFDNLISGATKVQGLGDSARCGGVELEKLTSVFCQFSQGGRSYVVALRTDTPKAEASEQVQGIAEKVSGRAES